MFNMSNNHLPLSLKAEQNVFEQNFKSINNHPGEHNNLSPEEKQKRERFLERNRIAATKCRQKKKTWIKELNYKTDQERMKNISLQKQVEHLRDQILSLKAQLVPHLNCDCEIISKYKCQQQ